jgi:DNA uptake protein ComE-like DNA-binding protein
MKKKSFLSKVILGIVSVSLLAACSAPASTAAPVATSATGTTTNTSTTATSTTKVNLNTGTEAQFLAIPNVNSRMVREFNEYRPYASILQFRREIGKYVDAAQVAAYEQYVYVPVDVNQADADTLKQLPGVTDAIAADLIAARPYASTEAFLTKLGGAVSADDLTAASSYLAP